MTDHEVRNNVQLLHIKLNKQAEATERLEAKLDRLEQMIISLVAQNWVEGRVDSKDE